MATGTGVATAGNAASITGVEGQPLTNVVVDSVPSCAPRDIRSGTVSIDWGDGTTSAGTAAAGSVSGTCDITGIHTYVEEGSYKTSVTYTFVTGGPGGPD